MSRKLTEYRRKYLRFKIAENRRILKQKAIVYKGGKCQKCGYDKCPTAMVFHHLDPSIKDFGIAASGKFRTFEKCKPELDKCILLCSNCHLELHHQEYQKQRENKIQELEQEKSKRNSPLNLICDNCQISFLKDACKIQTNNFCSIKCKQEFDEKHFWISNSELRMIYKEMSVRDISKRYNVSISTVYRRLQKLK